MRFIDDFVNYCQEFTGCPDVFLRWSALLALSAVAGDRHVHRRGDWDVRPNLWVLLIGNSSSYKSAGLNAARRLLSESCSGVLAAQEYSHEAMLEDLAINPHRVFYYDEAHSFFSMLESPYNKGKMKSAFMSLYGRVPIERKIKGKDGHGETHTITGAYVCWGGASTTVQLTDVLGGRTTDLLSGLFPRFLMVPYFGAETSIEDPPPANQDKRVALINTLQTLAKTGEREYTYTQEALDEKRRWLARFNKRANASDNLLSAFYRKMRDEHMHKVCMLSAFERGDTKMTIEDLGNAINLLWPIEKAWPQLIERMTEKEWDRETTRVEDYLKANVVCDRGDIFRAVRGIKAQKLSAILKGFEQDGKVEILPAIKEGVGRPRLPIKYLGG